MKNRLTTEPTEEPVTLAGIRLQLGIGQDDDTDRDSIISTRITSARRWAEHHTESVFITQTWTGYADCFERSMDLKCNLQSVASVKYIDSDKVQQTLDASVYDVDLIESRVVLATGQSWPATYAKVNAIEIEHVSGFGSANDVPEEIKDAIKFIVGHWENYQTSIEGAIRISTIPYAVEQLLKYHKDYRNIF